MTHKQQITIEDFPEETLPEGKELSGISGLDSRVKTYLKLHPEFKLSKIESIRETQINIILNKLETPEEHQVALMQYIQHAKAQTETDQFKFETRLVEYVEEFYSKFCKVELSPDQINDIRIRWVDLNRTKEKSSYIPDLTYFFQGNNSVIVCDGCIAEFYGELNKFDFYLAENIKDGHLIGTRQESGEISVLHKDAVNPQMCENCDEFVVTHSDDDDFENHKQFARHELILNPNIEEKLSEQLRAQKYNSTNNVRNIIDAHKLIKVARKRILQNKGTDGLIVGYTKLPEGIHKQKITPERILTADISRLAQIEKLDRNEFVYNQPLNMFSNGNGKDSITEIVLNHAFWDQIVFADTGSEQKETYEFIEKFTKQLPKVTRYKIRVVHSRYGVIYDYYHDRPNPMTPMFTKRDCTEKFKIEPIKQWIKGKYGLNPMAFRGQEIQDEDGNPIPNPNYDANERGSKKILYQHKIVMGLGINYAESWRKHDGNVWYIKNTFPLIEKKITKDDEPMIIKALGVDVPVKSGCFFCFFGNKNYWLKLRREHQDHYDLAVKFYADAKHGSDNREDGGGMRLELVKFPTDEEFAEYMKKFPSCGDGEVELGCECMTGNMNSGMTRGRELPEEELSTKLPMAGF